MSLATTYRFVIIAVDDGKRLILQLLELLLLLQLTTQQKKSSAAAPCKTQNDSHIGVVYAPAKQSEHLC